MADQTENRRINGGLDTVTAPFDIKDGAFLNAVNFRTVSAQDGQQAGYGNFIEGNVEVASITAVLPAGDNILVGKTAAPEFRSIYLAFYNATGSFILAYNTSTDTAAIIFNDSKVDGGLAFTADMFVDMRVASGLLIWVTGVGDIRYLSLATDYMSGGTLSAAELSMISEPPAIPLTSARNNTAGVNSTIQFNTVQFTYRFVNQDGFTSVLAPYSLTSFPPRETAIAANANTGNTITVAVPVEQKIPANWRYVDLVVRFPDQGDFYVIKRWSRATPADNTAITNHNAGSPLTFTNWAGVLGELLDDAYIAKQNDNSPLNAQAIETVANRVAAANFQEGYDTAPIDASLNISPITYSVAQPTAVSTNVYLLFVKKYNVDEHYFALVIREGATNYLLPKESSIGFFKYGFMPNPNTVSFNQPVTLGTPVFSIPLRIHRSALIKLQESGNFIDSPGRGPANNSLNPTLVRPIRERIVVEANSLSNFQSEFDGSGGVRFDHWSVFYATIELMSDAPAASLSGRTRALLPGASYNLSLQLYDAALRKSGRQPVLAAYSTPQLTSLVGTFTEALIITPVLNTGSLPAWAEYFSVVVSKNQLTSRVIHFVAGLIKLAVSENDQVLYRGRASYPTSSALFTRGIAFEISQLATAGYGYEFQQGDILEYAYIDPGSSVYTTGRLVIREVVDGYIITYDDSGQLANIQNMLVGRLETFTIYWTQAGWQTDMAVANALLGLQPQVTLRILSRNQTDVDLYEVALFGEVVQAGPIRTFGNFFASGLSGGIFFGDTHLQARFGYSGSATAVAITTNERNTLNWITDSGRIAPEDTIGQSQLPTAIRWSNVHIPGASNNGYASFDALDIKFVDETAGPIRALVLTTRNNQDGGQLVVLCENGSFVALVGQQQLTDQSGDTGLTVAANVFGDFNMIRGGYGCSSPRSVSRWQHHVWWVDTIKREVIEFNDGGAGSIAGMGMTRLFRETLARAVASGDVDRIATGVNPYTREMMLTIPASSPTDQPDLATVVGLENPFNAYVDKPTAWFFNYEQNRWQSRHSIGAEFINVADDVFGWRNGKVWREFKGQAGEYYGSQENALIAIPFNAGHPMIKTPLAVRIVAERAPAEAWVMTNGDGRQHVSGVGDFERREDYFRATIRRDRTTGGASDDTAWKMAGVNGATLKGSVVYLVLIFEPDEAPINLSLVSIEWSSSQGQGKQQA